MFFSMILCIFFVFLFLLLFFYFSLSSLWPLRIFILSSLPFLLFFVFFFSIYSCSSVSLSSMYSLRIFHSFSTFLPFLIFFSPHHIVHFFLLPLTPLRISFLLSFPFLHTPLSSSFTSPYLLLFLPPTLFRIITQTPIHVVFINTIMIKIN